MIVTMDVLRDLGIEPSNPGAYEGDWIDTTGDVLVSDNPATGEQIANVREASAADYERVSAAAHGAFLRWRFPAASQRILPVAPLLAFSISAMIGVVFGIYPSMRAADMDPVEALRHE